MTLLHFIRTNHIQYSKKYGRISSLIILAWFFLLNVVLIYGKHPLTSHLALSRTTEFDQRSCPFVKGLHSNLIRFITQEGFHRDLEDTVEVTVTTSSIPINHFMSGQCLLGVLHHLCKDVYVDPYEILRDPSLSDYIRIMNNWTDLESPAWLAKSNSTVFVQLKPILTGNLISTEQVRLPVHYRYQMPRSHSRLKNRGVRNTPGTPSSSGMLNPAGYIPVTLPLPELILRCEYWDSEILVEQCKTTPVICNREYHRDSKCLWVLLPYKSNFKSGTVYIPIGDSDTTFLITTVTMGVLMCGMLFLILTIYKAKCRLDIESQTCTITTPADDDHAHTD